MLVIPSRCAVLIVYEVHINAAVPWAEWRDPVLSACPLSRARLSADGRSPHTAGPCAHPDESAPCAPPSSASPAAASLPDTGTGAGHWTGPRCAASGRLCAPTVCGNQHCHIEGSKWEQLTVTIKQLCFLFLSVTSHLELFNLIFGFSVTLQRRVELSFERIHWAV